jgi:hypothetical protein
LVFPSTQQIEVAVWYVKRGIKGNLLTRLEHPNKTSPSLPHVHWAWSRGPPEGGEQERGLKEQKLSLELVHSTLLSLMVTSDFFLKGPK